MADQQSLEQRITQLETELQQKEQRFRSFLRLTRQAYACLQFDTPISTKLPPAQQASFMLAAKLIDCNDEFAKIYQASRATDLIGARYVSLILATDKFILRARRFVTSGYRLVDEEIERPMPDGSRKILIGNAFGEIHDESLVRLWITMEDVTLRRLAEKVANSDVAALSEFDDGQDYAFWLIDWQDFQVLYVGHVYEDVWRLSKQELFEDPMSWLKAVHEDDRDRVRGAFLSQAAKGSYDETFRMILPDQSIRLIRDRGFPIAAEDGTVGQIVGLAADVTEPFETRVGLDHFFQCCEEMLIIINSDGTLREANGAFFTTTGYTADDLADTDLIDLVHEEDKALTENTVGLLNEGKAAVDVTNRFQCKDGSWKTFMWNIAPVLETGSLYATARVASTGEAGIVESDLERFDLLTPRETQIMRLIVDGRTNKAIARDLGISQRTVEKHRQRVMNKLEVDNVPDLVKLAISWGR